MNGLVLIMLYRMMLIITYEWLDVEHHMSLANIELNLHRSNLILNVITLRSISVAKYSGVASSKVLVGHTLREGMVLMMDCKNSSCLLNS